MKHPLLGLPENPSALQWRAYSRSLSSVWTQSPALAAASAPGRTPRFPRGRDDHRMTGRTSETRRRPTDKSMGFNEEKHNHHDYDLRNHKVQIQTVCLKQSSHLFWVCLWNSGHPHIVFAWLTQRLWVCKKLPCWGRDTECVCVCVCHVWERGPPGWLATEMVIEHRFYTPGSLWNRTSLHNMLSKHRLFHGQRSNLTSQHDERLSWNSLPPFVHLNVCLSVSLFFSLSYYHLTKALCGWPDSPWIRRGHTVHSGLCWSSGAVFWPHRSSSFHPGFDLPASGTHGSRWSRLRITTVVNFTCDPHRHAHGPKGRRAHN